MVKINANKGANTILTRFREGGRTNHVLQRFQLGPKKYPISMPKFCPGGVDDN